MLRQVAIVSEVPEVTFSEIAKVGAAVQKQVMRDFAPIWEIQATVDAFAVLEDVPIGYWPVIIQKDIGFNAAGIHLDKDGQPFSLVQHEAGWSMTVSHEVLEMLADPFGDRVIAGPSLHPQQDRVEYLVEVCDPSEDLAYSYTVNGITVSDFYTPHYFDPVKSTGVRYGFGSGLKAPRQVLKGGYLSWHDPISDHWWQQTWFGSSKTFRDLGVLPAAKESIRELIDRRTRHRYWTPGASNKVGTPAKGMSALLASTAAPLVAASKATASKAVAWRAQIQALKGNKDFQVL